MAERSNAAVSKTVIRLNGGSRVQIPPSPLSGDETRLTRRVSTLTHEAVAQNPHCAACERSRPIEYCARGSRLRASVPYLLAEFNRQVLGIWTRLNGWSEVRLQLGPPPFSVEDWLCMRKELHSGSVEGRDGRDPR